MVDITDIADISEFSSRSRISIETLTEHRRWKRPRYERELRVCAQAFGRACLRLCVRSMAFAWGLTGSGLSCALALVIFNSSRGLDSLGAWWVERESK